MCMCMCASVWCEHGHTCDDRCSVSRGIYQLCQCVGSQEIWSGLAHHVWLSGSCQFLTSVELGVDVVVEHGKKSRERGKRWR